MQHRLAYPMFINKGACCLQMMKTYLSFFASMFDSTIWVMTRYSRWLICSKIYQTGLVTQTHQNINCADLD